jgi:hypothetical protein
VVSGAPLETVLAHLLYSRAPSVVHATPPRLRILRCGLGEVNRELGGLELIPLGDDRARLRQPLSQLLRTRIEPDLFWLAPAAQEAEQGEPAEQRK